MHWDWDDFWETFSNIFGGIVIIGLVLGLVGLFGWLLWTTGFGFIVIIIGSIAVVSGVCATVYTVFKNYRPVHRENRVRIRKDDNA